jgi:acetylornithine deacetylase
VDAIRHAGLLLAELDRIDTDELPQRQHHLLGRASLHASTIEGGLGLSTYPDRCTLRIERRTIPGESLDQVRSELSSACDRIRAQRPDVQMSIEVLFAQPPSDVALDAPICQALSSVLTAQGLSITPVGMSAWTDAALLNEAGIPAICFGPGDMGLAHAAEEYIPIAEVEQATDVLRTLASEW